VLLGPSWRFSSGRGRLSAAAPGDAPVLGSGTWYWRGDLEEGQGLSDWLLLPGNPVAASRGAGRIADRGMGSEPPRAAMYGRIAAPGLRGAGL